MERKSVGVCVSGSVSVWYIIMILQEIIKKELTTNIVAKLQVICIYTKISTIN